METTLKLPRFLMDDLNILYEIEEELKTPYLSMDDIKLLLREIKSFKSSIMNHNHDYLEAWR